MKRRLIRILARKWRQYVNARVKYKTSPEITIMNKNGFMPTTPFPMFLPKQATCQPTPDSFIVLITDQPYGVV
ncbi:hypothetical protein [Anaerorudis cellulosivorans]|uniref:hypothetical protein n=1 Tax=Anaerorudis cellulosivorans TaxID=3397862 RepID=UPI00221FF02B|nr:hypothetical protein [Seramator thermalis]MCW1736208.1 hypothetical protein [Seramator thermalis]